VIVQRWTWRRVDQVLSVSADLTSRMAAEMRFPVERIRTIRNGVDLSRFAQRDRRGARELLQLPPDALVIGTVGRLVPVKNQALLLDAIARLHAEGIHVVGLLAGDGPLRQELTARADALGIAAFVRFLGERQDVERVFAAMDIFVLPSVSEGMSNTIQEAMASGLPVIATRVGGAGELVADGKTGILVPSRDVEALSGAMARLASDAHLRQVLGEAGRHRARHEFGLARMVRDYEDLYYELAERRQALLRRAPRQQLVGT
jgi:glycosyltransferase involved in cell wall biosynthesis